MFLRKSPVFVLWLGSLLLGCLLASVGMPGYGQVNLPGQPGTPGGVEPTPPLEGAEPAGVVGRPVTAAVATEGAEPSGLVTGPAPAPARAEEGAAPAPAAHADWWDNISRTLQKYGLFQGVQASGQNSLTFQHNFLEGSQQAFDDDRWDTGDFYRQSSVEVAGPVWKDFGFQLDMSDAGWGQDYTQWVLGYVGHDTAIYFGSLNVNLPGNEFASFSQSVQGLQIDQLLPGKGLMRAFYAQQNGYTHSDTVPGNNTSGPYFLTYTPIIEGSLTVKVNETVLSLGTDYTVDYQTGELDLRRRARLPGSSPAPT